MLASSWKDFAISGKNGFDMSATIKPRIELRPTAKLRAAVFGR